MPAAMTCPLFDEDDLAAANLAVIDITEKGESVEEDEYYGDDDGFEAS